MSPTPTPPALADSVNLDEGRALLEKAITLLPWPTRVTTSKESGEYLTMPGWASFGNNEAAAKLFLMVPALLSAVAALERERDEAVKAERERCAVLRVWLLDLSANESDPNEPVADNGATVWDHIRGDARRFAESLT